METVKSGIKVQTTALAGYDQIVEPGVYALKVASTVSEKNLVQSENGRKSYIVSLKAIAEDKLGQVKEVFQGKQEVDIEDTNGCFMTGNIWVNDGAQSPALPMKGETVKASVDYVKAKDAEDDEATVLRITAIQVQAAKKAEKLNILDFFASSEKSATPAGETLVQKKVNA
jgi:hypothetical protein